MVSTARKLRLRACSICGGDAHLGQLDVFDDPEWRCLQCGRPVPETADLPAALERKAA